MSISVSLVSPLYKSLWRVKRSGTHRSLYLRKFFGNTLEFLLIVSDYSKSRHPLRELLKIHFSMPSLSGFPHPSLLCFGYSLYSRCADKAYGVEENRSFAR